MGDKNSWACVVIVKERDRDGRIMINLRQL
jgi:hypothetical protein